MGERRAPSCWAGVGHAPRARACTLLTERVPRGALDRITPVTQGLTTRAKPTRRCRSIGRPVPPGAGPPASPDAELRQTTWGEIPPGRPVGLVCSAGHRSHAAAGPLVRTGHRAVLTLL